MFNEKEKFVENVSLEAEPMGKVPWLITCANMVHERVPGRSANLWEGCLVTELS